MTQKHLAALVRSLLLTVAVVPSVLVSQVIIKEKVAIDPKMPRPPLSATAIGDGPLLEGTPQGFRTTVRGVRVSVSVSATPAQPEEYIGYEISVTGFGWVKRAVNCPGSYPESGVSSLVFPSCVTISVAAYERLPGPYYYSCLPHPVGGITGSVSGNSATWNIAGQRFNATVTLTASLDESYQPAEVVLTPQTDSISCNGGTTVDVTLLNGRGELYTTCTGSPITGTATIDAKGAYAYLSGGGQSGKSIDISVSNGRGAFAVVLDTSKGIIPKGFDASRIFVTLENRSGNATVAMMCQYPPPTVVITYPPHDTTIELSSSNQPVITLTEAHTPHEGDKFAPSISWDPSNVIDTRTYYGQIQDSLVISVKVTAENDGGTATDARKITLKKKGCEDAPQCDSPPSPPDVAIRVVPRGYAGFDPCGNPPSSRGVVAGVFSPVLKPPGNLWQPFTVQPCFNQQSEKWQFAISKIEFNAVMDICAGNLGQWKLVDNPTEIPDQDVCGAIKDLENHRTYPLTVKIGGYMFKSVLLKHEQAHKRTFEEFMIQHKAAFDANVLNYQPTCEDFGSQADATDRGVNQINFIFNNYRDDFIGDWGTQTGTLPSDPAKHAISEQTTHQHNDVQKEINDLLLALKARCQ